MKEYIVEINMAEPVFDTKPIWQAVEMAPFPTRERAQDTIDYMKAEYGTAIGFRIVEKEMV